MQKVVVQILRAPVGGIRKHVYDILEYFKDKDVQQIFITNLKDADLPVPKAGNIQVFDLAIEDQPGLNDFKNLITIIKILKNFEVSVIHGHGAKGGIYARVVSLFLNSKCIYTPHGGSLHRIFGKVKNKFFDTVELILTPFTDVFLFESIYSYKEFSHNVCPLKKKAIVNYNGVAIPTSSAKSNYKAGDKIRLASFGLLRHLKGHDIVIDACAMLLKNNIPFEYVIYGAGEEKEKLELRIHNHKLENYVIIKDYSCSVEQEMLNYDFILQPSRFESFGYVPVEAMALKIPVIVSWSGGLKEVVDEKSGYVSYENTPESYFEILRSLYVGDPTLNEKVLAAYEKVQRKFSKNSMLKKIEEIYFT